MKVVIAGASGSGKTTLAKALAEKLGWEFKENSAGMIILPQDKVVLKEEWGYTGNLGQREVINWSHCKSMFGKFFQQSILRARTEMIQASGGKNCVWDRSPIDPVVYWLNQVVHNSSQSQTEEFIHECRQQLSNIQLVLRIPLQNPKKEIENNGSRVNIWHFQRKIDYLFDLALNMIYDCYTPDFNLLPGVEYCPCWDWEKRLNWAEKTVRSYMKTMDIL